MAAPIWIADLSDSSVVPVPREVSNDTDPMWVGGKVYFLSDRNGPVTLFSYDPKGGSVTEVIHNDGPDFKSASAGPGAIIYTQLGSLHLYDLIRGKRGGSTSPFPATCPSFGRALRRSFRRISSPAGSRPRAHAPSSRPTARSSRSRQKRGTFATSPTARRWPTRDPSWSPDGKSIAYFSDKSGEYALHISDQTGVGTVRAIDLGIPPSFFYRPTWSPDSKKIAYYDKRGSLWYLELDHPAPVKVDTDRFGSEVFELGWSSDSRWLAYTKRLENHLHAIFVYSSVTAQATQLTDGMSDATLPVFDKNGKQLYFAASTDSGPTTQGLDMASDGRSITRNAYVVVLRKDLPSPLAPESDEEKGDKADKADAPKDSKPSGDQADGTDEKEDKVDKPAAADKGKEDGAASKAKKKEPAKVEIDFDNISQRILAIPVPAVDILALASGKEGILHVVYTDKAPQGRGETVAATLSVSYSRPARPRSFWTACRASRFQPTARRCSTRRTRSCSSCPRKRSPSRRGRAQDRGNGGLRRAPRGVAADLPRDMADRAGLLLRPALPRRRHRRSGKGLRTVPGRRRQPVGLELPLGTCWATSTCCTCSWGEAPTSTRSPSTSACSERITRSTMIATGSRAHDGENWNPNLHAPLTQPGVNVKAGEYLLAVNGRPLHALDDLDSFSRRRGQADGSQGRPEPG